MISLNYRVSETDFYWQKRQTRYNCFHCSYRSPDRQYLFGEYIFRILINRKKNNKKLVKSLLISKRVVSQLKHAFILTVNYIVTDKLQDFEKESGDSNWISSKSLCCVDLVWDEREPWLIAINRETSRSVAYLLRCSVSTMKLHSND